MTPLGMTTPWRGPRSMVRGLSSVVAGSWGVDEVDEQAAFDYIEELVLSLMVVPVIISCTTPRRTTESFTIGGRRWTCSFMVSKDGGESSGLFPIGCWGLCSG